MASFNFTTSAQAIFKAGANANATAVANTTALNLLSDEIEAIICDTARYDLVTNYASLDAKGKIILGSIASAYVAKYLINYSVFGYGQLRGVETMLDILENDIRRGLDMIKDDKVRAYLGVTA